MRDINVGIIGWGFMGKTHALALRSIPLMYEGVSFRPRIAGICSRRIDIAQAAADEQDCAYYTDDYRELIARPDIDAVSICTPNNLHEEMAIAALKAGKHVYLDKPMTISSGSAHRILAAAESAGSLAQMVMNNRFFPATLRAKSLIDEGRLGRITQFRIEYLHSGAIDPTRTVGWKQDKDICGGGVLLDLGSHAIDMLYYLLGEIDSLSARTITLYNQRPTKTGDAFINLGDDATIMMIKLKSGAMGTMDASKIATGAQDELRFEIHGVSGALKFNTMHADWLEFYDNTAPDTPNGGTRGYTLIDCGARYDAPGGTFLPPKNAIGWFRAHIACYYNFLDCLSRNVMPSPSLKEGAYIQRVMDAAYESSESGAWTQI